LNPKEFQRKQNYYLLKQQKIIIFQNQSLIKQDKDILNENFSIYEGLGIKLENFHHWTIIAKSYKSTC
jgi:hypothetical protein